MKKLRKPENSSFKIKKAVPDTSVLINGKLREMIEKKKLRGVEIIIPEIVIGELQGQASKGKEVGFSGLEEVKKIRKMSKKYNIKVNIVGERPSYEDILLARSGRIDALIQDVAKKNNATLITADLPQALVAEAQGINVQYFKSYKKLDKMKIEKFFTKDTMSLHIKENTVPLAKRGKPGMVELIPLTKKKISADEIEDMINEILEAARHEEDSFIEFSEHGASVIQLKHMRIAIARKPFSDGLELTVVKPIVKLTLNDYALSSKLKKRLSEKAEGILIAGPPGSGKSCFAASLAEFYLNKNKIVKTMESPRDLQVPPEVTQYAPLKGSFVKTSDILLLVRPDFTIFDELRKTKDFEVFADMRMAGIGMVGVVHSTEAVDAVQRFIGRIELGVIPHVIDTIIYIKDGEVRKVYSLSMTVRVPTGMTEADLARPLVEVNDFETGKLEYEIYTYGEQTIVIPVKPKKKALQRLAESRILEELRRFDRNVEIEFLSDEKIIAKVNNDMISRLIGRDGETITGIEKKLGIGIDVQPLAQTLGKKISFRTDETGGYIVLFFKKNFSRANASIYVDNEYLFSATIGHSGQIKISKKSDLGEKLIRAITGKKDIRVFI